MAKLIYVVDIDGTICTNTYGEYQKCLPKIDRITQINQLFDAGHHIIYATARGMGSSEGDQALAAKKYYNYTFDQLHAWGCKFHSLYLGKPKGDIYIDDKCIRDVDFFDE